MLTTLSVSIVDFEQISTLPEKYPNTEFFLSVFSRIRTEYGVILCISPYSVRIPENADQKKLRIWTDFTQGNLLVRNKVFPLWNIPLIGAKCLFASHNIFKLAALFKRRPFHIKLCIQIDRRNLFDWKYFFWKK